MNISETIDSFSFLNQDYKLDEKWIALFAHYISLDQHNKMPSKAWYKELETLVDAIGKEEFLTTGYSWINDCIEKVKSKPFFRIGVDHLAPDLGENIENSIRKPETTPEWVKKVYNDDLTRGRFFSTNAYFLENFQNYFYYSLGGRILRGFMHATIVFPGNENLVKLVEEMAFAAPNTSQDAIYIFSHLSKDISVPILTKLKTKVRHKNTLKKIDKAFVEIGKREGVTKSEIEESVVPDKGVVDGTFSAQIGDYRVSYTLQNIRTQTTSYLSSEGKTQKTLPKFLKENYDKEVKQFKKTCKEIKTSLSSQKNRIEAFYLIDREIEFDNFIKNYFDNALIHILSKDLIWNFTKGDLNINLIFNGENFQDVDGKEYKEELKGSKVRLWHPIGFESNYVLKWREYILEKEILQPFKQAFREVYIITDAEINTLSYSNRYASHILNKDHLAALSKVRGWSPSALNYSEKVTYKIPDTDYKVEYWVGDIYLGDHSSTYGSAHVTTDQVRFYKKRTQLNLTDVPANIFSEVMRDVDLFVGVTSIGNDPNWADRGDQGAQNYWQSYSFGELSNQSVTRSEMLKTLIPKLKIGKQCSFDKRFLIVKGKIKTYKIHMGSGNILMEPNDQYLCIVANRSKGKSKVFIPFEGDEMLSIIISKAVLLAADDKITDQTIVSQINA